MSTTTELKLLPCPFCGAEAEIAQSLSSGDGNEYVVECSTCDALIPYSVTEEEASAAWNRRSAAHGEPSKDALSVTRILLDVVPGAYGMGHEVYAKSVKEVEDLLSKQALRIEELETQLGVESAGSAEQVSEREALLADLKWHKESLARNTEKLRAVFQDLEQARAALQHTAHAPSQAGEWPDERIEAAFERDCLRGMSAPSTWDETTRQCIRFARKFYTQGVQAVISSAPAQAWDQNAPNTQETSMDTGIVGGPKAAQAQSEDARDAVLAEAKNTILWLLHRLPKGYDKPPHVLRTISTLDAAMSTQSEKEPSNG